MPFDGRFAALRASLVLICAFWPMGTMANAEESSAAHALTVAVSQLDSSDGVRRALSAAASDAASAIIVSVSPYSQGDLPFDGLAALIRGAHDRGLRVVASLNTNIVTGVDELPLARDHVLYTHPEWLMVPRAIAAEMLHTDVRSPGYVGRLARWTRANASRVAGLYLSPLSPAAAEYVANATEALVRRYDFDGLEVHAAPCPEDFDYSRTAMDVFRAELRARLSAADRARMDGIEDLDPFAYADEYPDEWRLFQRARLDDLVDRVSASARTARPSILLAAGNRTGAEDTH
jgi:uncharacterized lipoprotein YddW (UPF0748 family)